MHIIHCGIWVISCMRMWVAAAFSFTSCGKRGVKYVSLCGSQCGHRIQRVGAGSGVFRYWPFLFSTCCSLFPLIYEYITLPHLFWLDSGLSGQIFQNLWNPVDFFLVILSLYGVILAGLIYQIYTWNTWNPTRQIINWTIM